MRLLLLPLVLLSSTALAYQDGSFQCKNDDLPANTYKISTVSVGGGLPFLEIHRSFRDLHSNQVVNSEIKGVASISSVEAGGHKTEYLILGAITLELDDGVLAGCEKP